jgi:Flp pilus assembly protein TadB
MGRRSRELLILIACSIGIGACLFYFKGHRPPLLVVAAVSIAGIVNAIWHLRQRQRERRS